VRVTAHVYNSEDQFTRLAAALIEELGAGRTGSDRSAS